MFASTSIIGALIGYFVKISKEGKRHDRVKECYESGCPLTAVESQELVNENNVKYVLVCVVNVVSHFSTFCVTC